MAKYGSADVEITIDDGTLESPGTPQEVQTDILDLPGVDIEALTEEGHGFGEDWVKNLATGLSRVADITLRGFYDDTALTGTDALFNRVGTSTSLAITWGGSKVTTIPILIKNYRRLPARGELTKFEAVLVAAGDLTSDV